MRTTGQRRSPEVGQDSRQLGVPRPAAGRASPLSRITSLQRTAGNRVVTRLLQRTAAVGATATQASAEPVVDRLPVGSRAPVVQRKNAFWGEMKASHRENPLATIAKGLVRDAKVPANVTVDHWRTGTNLAVAKTAKKDLTTDSMADVVRPEGVSAWLDTPNPKPGTRKDPSWITAYGNLGTVEDQIVGATPQKYNGGHLIAWEFLNEAANVKGNIAPQAMLQNQALFRRIERTLEETVGKGGNGVEVTVTTPYRHDNTMVTYRQLFERKVLTSDTIRQAVEKENALDTALPIAQMAPDTYDLYLLTQTGVTHPATPDKREAREGIKTFALSGYTDAIANKVFLDKKPEPLSILASNVDPTTLQQTAVAFAHLVFLNYRTTASPIENARAPVDDETLEEKRLRALEVIQENERGLAVLILQALVWEDGLSPTDAETALVIALIESEPPEDEGMDVEDK